MTIRSGLNIKPSKSDLISLFDQIVPENGDQPAVKGRGFSCSYREFRLLTCQFADTLLQNGIHSGDYVGICLERSAEMVIGIFGILRAGAAYVPADPQAPASRIREIFTDAGVRYVVTTDDLSAHISSLGFVPLVPEKSASRQDLFITPEPNPENPAYVLFTSGSTGKPKGVVVPHRAVANLIRYMQELYPLQPGDTVLLKSPYTFDGSVWELFGWILMGGTLYVAEPGVEKDPARLLATCKNERISFLFFVPAMLRSFLEYLSMSPDPSEISTIKWVSVGGEVLPPMLVNRFYQLFGKEKARLINVYGPTETTVYATTFLCDPLVDYTKIPVGFPVTNDKIYILNDQLLPVLPGEEGEICIGGAGVASGYLNDAILTAEKFVDDPFISGGKLYRTGDIGRQLESGAYDFIGRHDFQVKLRGLRIELGEIEYALNKLPQIAEGIVLFSKDHHGDDALIAYIRPDITASINPEKTFRIADTSFDALIREALGKSLPQYMIPAFFVISPEFQLTKNGKVDRGALPLVSTLVHEQTDHEFLPGSPAQETLYAIWKDVLGRNAISGDESFFEAGGHSIKAIQLIIEVKKAFDTELPLKVIYQEMTLHRMCRLLEEQPLKTRPDEKSSFLSEGNDPYSPITMVQEEMWILNSVDPSGLIHNIQVEFIIRGDVDIPRFFDVLKTTVHEEEIFNSAFPAPDGRPVRLTVKPVDIEIPVSDLSALPAHEREIRYSDIQFQHGQIRFDLEKPPLFSFRLVILAPDDLRLLFTVHHIIFDGWSLFLFMQRLRQGFDGLKPFVRPGGDAEFAARYNRYVLEERWEQEIGFWKSMLRGIPAQLTLPKKQHILTTPTNTACDRHWWSLSEQLSLQIEEVSKACGVTPFITLISAYQLILGAFARQDDVVVGTPYANRLDPDVAGLIGYYTNMVSLRGVVKNADTARSYLLRNNRFTIDAFSNAAVPFGEIAKKISGNIQLGINPVFQSIFVLQNWPHIDLQFPGFTLQQREIGNHTSKTDLMLNVEKSGSQYVCWLEYDPGLFDVSLIRQIANSYGSLLKGMTDDLEQPLQTLISQTIAPVSLREIQSCIVVGNGRLAVQCSDLLLASGFNINAIVSAETIFRTYAVQKGIHLSDNLTHFSEFQEVDYIFSINNGFILKKPFTSLARSVVVNYHDAPLPRYAGMFATHWAILNGEKEHGVSWHVVTDEIDGGDLLNGEGVHIDPNDTVAALNAKCFEAALRSFSRLLHNIREDRLVPVPQNPDFRTYFSLALRPDNFGCISGNLDANAASALLRATHCGNHMDNEFLTPFIIIKDQIYFIPDAAIQFTADIGHPGSIVDINGEIAITLQDCLLIPQSLYDQSGQPVDPSLVLSPGDMTLMPDEQTSGRIAAYFQKIARHEPFWRKELEASEYLKWPISAEESPSRSVVIPLPENGLSRIMSLFPDEMPDTTLMAALFIYLLKLNDQTVGAIACSSSSLSADIKDLEHIFNPWAPLRGSINPNLPVKENIRNLMQAIKKAEKAGTFTRSAFIRYPSLREKENIHPEIMLFRGVIPEPALVKGMTAIGISGYEITILIPPEVIVSGAGAIAEGFCHFLENISVTADEHDQQMDLVSVDQWKEHPRAIHQHPAQNTRIDDVLKKFIAASREYPGNIAVYDNGKSYNYQRFSDDVDHLAAVLTENGISSGKRVAIVANREYPYFLSLMAILRCGACFIPIDPGLPEKRQMMICQDAGVALILTAGVEEFDGIPVMRIFPRDEPDTVSSFPDVEISPNSLAYIIYTSGTTGRPKGVKISRKALSTFVSGALSIYKTTHTDRILQFCNLSFDASIEEIFMAFCTGASLYLRDEEMVKPEKLIGFSIQHQITTWDLPTAFWRQVMQSDQYSKTGEAAMLRLVIIGGEAVLPRDILHWESHQQSHRLINTYGPTETTVVAIAHEILPGQNAKSIPIGRPLPGYQVFIVNSENKSVFPGCTGELLVAGDGLASGYVNREKEENAAFIRFQPPGSTESTRCYRTGDRVAANASGTLFYMGRNDTQVKIRGFRVEPGEIEDQITRIEGIESCVVIASKQQEDEYRLIAFIQGDIRDYAGAIRNELSKNLPAYMVPERFIMVDQIPLTINGKADRKRLLQMVVPDEPETETLATPPFTPDELLVSGIWKKILNTKNFGIDDDFFELGGHSLKAIEFMSEIRKQRGVDISIASLIQNPTVRKFANLLSSGEHGAYWQCMVPIRTEGMKTPLFLIHGAGLNILLYQSLSNYLKPGRPIYALQAKGLDGKSMIQTNIGEMARDYMLEIEAIRPTGPIMLLGFSLGGFIAYEISRLMNEKGREVAFTGIIDAVTSLTQNNDPPLTQFLTKIKETSLKCCFTAKLISINLFKPGSTILKTKYRTFRAILVGNLTRFGVLKEKEHKIEYLDGIPQYLSNHVRILMWRALKQFLLIPANINVDLFKAGIATFYIPEKKDYGWRRYAKKGVVIHTIPGEHSLIFADPNDKIFAKILDDRLDESETKTPA